MTKPTAGSRRLGGVRYLLRCLPFALVLIVAACSAAPSASSPVATLGSATPTTAPSLSLPSTGPTADYSGILSLDAIEGGCTYLQSADGRKLEVIYPEGWHLQKSPLELIAPDGSVHSKGGDRVSIRGAEASDLVSICQIGPIIQATEVLDE